MRLLIELTYGRCPCRDCCVDRLQWRWYMANTVPGAFMVSLAPMPPICRHPAPVPTCRECRCWDYHACLDENEEPCHWVESDLCSACAERAPDLPAPAAMRA